MDFQNTELPKLTPLKYSFAADDVENDLRNLFIDLFETLLAGQAFDINVLGAAHLGSLDLVRKMVNADGLVLIEGDREEAATRYLYRAWKARNCQGRGFHFLRTYLQLLFPNAATVEQMAQSKISPYPTGLKPLQSTEPASHYSTSRVRVTIDARVTSWENVEKMHPILRSIIPARFLLYFTLLTVWNQKTYAGAAMLSSGIATIYPAASQPTEWSSNTFIGAAMSSISTITIYPQS